MTGYVVPSKLAHLVQFVQRPQTVVNRVVTPEVQPPHAQPLEAPLQPDQRVHPGSVRAFTRFVRQVRYEVAGVAELTQDGLKRKPVSLLVHAR